MAGVNLGRANGTDLNFGWAGNYARQSDMIIWTKPNVGALNIAFGRPLITVDTDGYSGTNVGGVRLADATTSADNFYGFAAARVKAETTNTLFNQGWDAPGGGYASYEAVDCFLRGSISVLVDEGTATVGGSMWIRTATAGDGTDIGNICAAEPTEGGFLVPNGQFMTPQDERNIAEFRLFTQLNG